MITLGGIARSDCKFRVSNLIARTAYCRGRLNLPKIIRECQPGRVIDSSQFVLCLPDNIVRDQRTRLGAFIDNT